MVALVGTYGPGYGRVAVAPSERGPGSTLEAPSDGAVKNNGQPAGRPGDATFDQRVQPSSKSEKTSSDKQPVGNLQKESGSHVGDDELSDSEEKQVRELKQRDQEVRAHEQAHATVGGSYASSPSYSYTVGPDGKRYATSGEVKIDTSEVRDNPKATIRKMDIVIRAALAPAEPSSQDLQVARQAQETRAKAQSELTKDEQSSDEGGKGNSADAFSSSGATDSRTLTDVAAIYREAQQRSSSSPSPHSAIVRAHTFLIA